MTRGRAAAARMEDSLRLPPLTRRGCGDTNELLGNLVNCEAATLLEPQKCH